MDIEIKLLAETSAAMTQVLGLRQRGRISESERNEILLGFTKLIDRYCVVVEAYEKLDAAFNAQPNFQRAEYLLSIVKNAHSAASEEATRLENLVDALYGALEVDALSGSGHDPDYCPF